jgi:hypothetical protein
MYTLDVQHNCPQRGVFLFCAPILVSNERRNEEKMSVVIPVLSYAWYLAGNFFIFLKHRGFGDFPITISNFLILVFFQHAAGNPGGIKKAIHMHAAH